MAVDLETSIGETVSQLQELLNRADSAEENLNEAREKLAAVGEEFDTNWDELSSR
jgi:hypothetical protein